MKIPERIIEDDEIQDYLKRRWLLSQYQKSKALIISWAIGWTKFWIKEPKHLKIRYFRINEQYRAIWYREEKILVEQL